jgi:hypothetical protein
MGGKNRPQTRMAAHKIIKLGYYGSDLRAADVKSWGQCAHQ